MKVLGSRETVVIEKWDTCTSIEGTAFIKQLVLARANFLGRLLYIQVGLLCRSVIVVYLLVAENGDDSTTKPPLIVKVVC